MRAKSKAKEAVQPLAPLAPGKPVTEIIVDACLSCPTRQRQGHATDTADDDINVDRAASRIGLVRPPTQRQRQVDLEKAEEESRQQDKRPLRVSNSVPEQLRKRNWVINEITST